MYDLQPDALGTPRVIIDPDRDVAVWRWELQGEAFGHDAPVQDPDNDGVQFVFDLRFPGQRFDAATGMNYNYFRDYEAGTGRYVQSDPIGLAGGISTYGYVGGSPMTRFDPNGLACRSAGGVTRCEYPNGPIFEVPMQPGWKDFDGSEFLYHNYEISRRLGCADSKAVMRELINHPTPSSNARPATTGGTKRNDASVPVVAPQNWVTSYLTTDLRNGNPLVVNITAPGSFFDPGYVARTITNGVVYTYGEGTSWTQFENAAGAWGAQSYANELVWGLQMERFIEKHSNNCGCP
jgi:RHS repeat-associated protein